MSDNRPKQAIPGDEQFAHVNGIEICYETFGEKGRPTMLLIMGLGTQMIHWDDRLCQLLADQGFWVVRFDNRDIGKSTKLSNLRAPSLPAVLANQWLGRKMQVPYDLQHMAIDALALLDFLNVKKAHLVGVSMGGMIAQCMAISAPKRILSLTSIMSTTGNRKLPKAKKSVALKIMQPPPKDEAGYLQHALSIWKLLHGNHFEFETNRVTKLLKRAKHRSYSLSGVWRQTCAILGSKDRTDQLKKLNLPSLIVHGDSDVLVPQACGEATVQAIPNSTLKIYRGMGHTLPEQIWPRLIEDIVTICEAGEKYAASS